MIFFLIEPIFALDGGEDGLDCYREISKDLCNKKMMAEKSKIYFEIDFEDANSIKSILEKDSNGSIKHIKTIKDHQNFDRCVVFEKN